MQRGRHSENGARDSDGTATSPRRRVNRRLDEVSPPNPGWDEGRLSSVLAWMMVGVSVLGVLRLLFDAYHYGRPRRLKPAMEGESDVEIDSGKEGIKYKHKLKPKLLQIKKPFQKFIQVELERASPDKPATGDENSPES